MLEPIDGVERRSRKRSSSNKTNLILAGVLVVLAVFAYWYELKQKPVLQQAEENKGKLFAFDQRREVESLSITDKIYKIDARFSCKANCKMNSPNPEWQMEKPLAFRADDTSVGSFITAVSNAAVAESIPLTGDVEKALASYGLSKDMRQMKNVLIKFKDNAAPYEVYFGDFTPVGENLYVWTKGPGVDANSVKMIPVYVRDYLKRGLSYWRNKKVFTFATSEIERFVLKNASGTTEFKKENGDWYYSGGKQADNESIDTFLTGVVFLNAKDFVSDSKQKDATKFGVTGAATAEVQLFTKGQNTGVSLSVYDLKKGKENKIYGTVSNTGFIAEFDRASIDKFARKPSSFKLKTLLTAADKSQAVNLSLSFDGKERFLFTTQDHQTWQLKEGKIDAFDPSSVETALQKVGTARISEFIDAKQPPSGNHVLSQWTFTDKQGKVIRSFQIYGSLQKGEYFVKLENGDVARLEKGGASAIPIRLNQFQRIAVEKK